VDPDLATLRRALRERFPEAVPAAAPPGHALAPPGTLCDLVGGPASGKCSLALLLLREVGGPVAYVDVAHELYPPAAAQAGIDLGRLILCRPGDETAALRAAERLLFGGWVRALALDRGARQEPLFAPACHRLRRAAREGNARLLVLSAVPCEASDARFRVERDESGVRLLQEKPPGARLRIAL
jgi:hypothetical protein